jgi:NAD(P)-dependent dehydrogenase (short-subunit alcohol dehydrogenase family)
MRQRLALTAAASAITVALLFLPPSPTMPLPPASFAGKRALVFGGTSGIGRGIALKLGEHGASVTVIGRDAARGEEVVRALRALNPGGAHAFAPCDAFLLREVATTAAAAAAPPLDVLVLSQGMATLQGFTPTVEGLDEKLALHYWGRVAATRALLPALRRAPSPVVLSVLSGGVHSPFAGWRDNFELSQGYSIPNAANAAGFYNDLAAEAQAKEAGNEKVLFLHAAPGFVNTRCGPPPPPFPSAPRNRPAHRNNT